MLTSAPTSAGPRERLILVSPESIGTNLMVQGKRGCKASEITSKTSVSSQEQTAGSLGLPSSHIPNFSPSSQNCPFLSLWMSRKLPRNAGSGDSELGVAPAPPPSRDGRFGGAGRGCGGVTPGSDPTGRAPTGSDPRECSPFPPHPQQATEGAPPPRSGAARGRPSLFLGCPPSWGEPSLWAVLQVPQIPAENVWKGWLGGRRASTIAVAIAIGGGERGCFPSAMDPEGFGSSGEKF